MVGTKDQIREYLNTLPNDETLYDFDKHREIKSRDANSYFHVLRDKLAVKLGTSKAYMKNVLIGKYGKIMYTDDGAEMIYKTNAPVTFMMEMERPHTVLIKETRENDKPVYWYRLYENTETYNSKEMSVLIDGTVEDCKEQGIETLAPDKLARLMSAWKEKYG